ncbi:YitT family protein [Cytobacillus spongiae]|jgi:uncharacterized membrane-anchored protein YitT (DUF2179 family)|uniref:YitT family protein n=1 Tax=Cytobacillus spongiae TaxID=2901381 RepID=UPI001F2D5FAB|nr:YitT family protein [Cytobacillus spongiae]UII54768.1 YitT family protein [Cytobacillus spongiae]
MKKKLKEYLLLNIGLILITINIHFFLAPNHFVIGGTSGLSIVIHHYIPNWPIGLILLVIELFLFLIGTLLLGFQFGLKSLYCSISLSLYVLGFEKFVPLAEPLSDDRIIQLIIGLVLDAIGLVIIFHQNASSGGTDIIAMILNKYLSLKIGLGILLADILIASTSFIVFSFESGMYAIVGIILLSIFINYFSSQLNLSKEVTIISSQCDDIKSYIVKELQKGATIHSAKGAFTNEDKDIITTFLGRKEFQKLKKYITIVDDKAFVTVHNTSEVIGNGFKRSL